VWESNLYVGVLGNDGVGAAEFHDLASAVPADLVTAIDALKAGLIDGSVLADDWSGQPPPSPAA